MASPPPNNPCRDWFTNYVRPFLLVPNSFILTAFFPAVLTPETAGACGRSDNQPITEAIMAESAEGSGQGPSKDEQVGEGRSVRGDGLTEAQRVVLERCILALKEAKNDSQTLAALLLITRLCPAHDLDKHTLRRIFEAVGLNLPARLLVTAFRRCDNSSLSPHDVLSLGTALLAALSTDSDMALDPQLLTTLPVLLGLIANGPMFYEHNQSADTSKPECNPASAAKSAGKSQPKQQMGADGKDAKKVSASEETSRHSKLDEAMASDCYQVLTVVSALPKGPDQLLRRGAVSALCQAIEQNQTLSHEKGLPLLGSLLSGQTQDKAWSKHTRELVSLLIRLSKDFCQVTHVTRLDMCAQLVQFMPPEGVAIETEELKGIVSRMWGALRPLIQAKVTPTQIGSLLVLGACLLDLCGWELVGPPKICCLLVNRACVEVRMGLEEPPGHDLTPELQQTLTGCYRIMEAALEQASSQKATKTTASAKSSIPGLTPQQRGQVLGVLEQAFSALLGYLRQVDGARFGDPFVFATFRSLCSWLAEETSCMKEEVLTVLPFMIDYSRRHLQRTISQEALSDSVAKMSVSEKKEVWMGREALRFLLPALLHLTGEVNPRIVLLTLDTPALVVEYLSHCWSELRWKSGAASTRNPSMETACGVLVNFTVTEPERAKEDSCFRTLEDFLTDTLPVVVSRPRLLILAAHFCTLGLLVVGLNSPPLGSDEVSRRRFFSTVLRFLRGALESSSSPGPAKVSVIWEEHWEMLAEFWRLSLQALAGCVNAQPSLTTLIREEGWLRHMLAMLDECSALPDENSLAALEEALCAIAEHSSICKEEIEDMMKNERGALNSMTNLKKSVGLN